MHKRLVLGSGISALTYLFHNKDSKALAGDSVGGMFKNNPVLGPQYLWVDDFSKEFMKMLRLPISERTVRVGIWYDGKMYTSKHEPAATLSKEIAEAYAKKTRGTDVKKSFMSSGKLEYKVFSTSIAHVTETLLKKVSDRLIPSKACKIDLDQRFVQDNFGDWFTYDNLVSTIPAPRFLDMAGVEGIEYLKGADKVYGLAPVTKCSKWVQQACSSGLDYVYCPYAADSWHRVTFVNLFEGPYAVFEFTNLQGTGFEARAFKDFFSSIVVQPLGQIVTGKELLKGMPENVKFLGRYAEWDHGVKFNDVLRRVVFEN